MGRTLVVFAIILRWFGCEAVLRSFQESPLEVGPLETRDIKMDAEKTQFFFADTIDDRGKDLPAII